MSSFNKEPNQYHHGCETLQLFLAYEDGPGKVFLGVETSPTCSTTAVEEDAAQSQRT